MWSFTLHVTKQHWKEWGRGKMVRDNVPVYRVYARNSFEIVEKDNLEYFLS